MTSKKKAASKREKMNEAKQPPKPPKPAAKASVPAKTPKVMLAEANERFKKDVVELRSHRRTMAGDLLQYRYDIGTLAIRIADEKQKTTHERHYGSRTVADIARLLEEALSTIYACMKFVKQISPKELADMKAKEWSWRAASSLLTVTGEPRKQLKADFEKGKFKTADEFRIAVKKTKDAGRMSGAKKERRGPSGSGGQAVSMINSCDTLGTQFVNRVIPEFIEGVRTYIDSGQKMSPATAEKIASGAKKVMGHFSAMEKLIQQAKKVVRDAGLVQAAPPTIDQVQAGARRNTEDGRARDDRRDGPRGYLDQREAH